MAHPLNFNRRGPGAADRYLKINDSGMRLTDLPGGPADKKLYSEFYGNMKAARLEWMDQKFILKQQVFLTKINY